MNELIKITESNGKKAVSARELYLKLGYDLSNWKRWFTKNITENQFAIENEDWSGFVIMTNGNETYDFALSIDFAKKISMMARTEAGEKIRDYFIEIEKAALQPLSEIQILQRSLGLIMEQQNKLSEHESRIKSLEEKPEANGTIQYFSILGYCRIIKKAIPIELALNYGKKCKRLCNELGLMIGKAPDSRFGVVNTYPIEVLKQIIS